MMHSRSSGIPATDPSHPAPSGRGVFSPDVGGGAVPQSRPKVRRRGRRVKDDGAPPFCWRKIVTPIAAARPAARVLDPAPPPPEFASSLTSDEEKIMSIDAQIEELRAELKASIDPDEIRQIETELAALLAIRDRLEAPPG